MGFLNEDYSVLLLLASVVFIVPTVMCMRWHPGWWVVSVGTVSFVLNLMLAADGIVEAFGIEGTGKKTGVAAAIYAGIATVSSAVGTFRMSKVSTKAKWVHMLGALLLSGFGGAATFVLVMLQLVYKDEHPFEIGASLCEGKSFICSPRFAVAVALLWVSLLAQIIIDCLEEETHKKLQLVLQTGRIAGFIGYLIILVGAFRSYRPNDNAEKEPDNLFGRLTLSTTTTGPYLGYAATSWVQNRTRRAQEGDAREQPSDRRDAAEKGHAGVDGAPAAAAPSTAAGAP